MGDTRINYTIALKKESQAVSKLQKSYSLSADSTLSEVIAHINTTIQQTIKNNNHDNNSSSGTNGGDTSSDETILDSNYSFFNDDQQEQEQKPLRSISLLHLYDCTTYPPKNVTSLVQQYTLSMGPKSITLQKLGWFPSAKLFICQSDDEATIASILTSNIHVMEEFEYNHPELRKNNNPLHRDVNASSSVGSGGVNSRSVKLTGELGASIAAASSSSSSQLLPSQVLKAVEGRFEHQNNKDDDESSDINNKARKKKQRTEEERRKLLDMRLEELDAKSVKKGTSGKAKKNKKVSDQVKKMLIKSRAEGMKKIRNEDRFYLDVVLMDESNVESDKDGKEQSMSSSYMFFSRVATIGKVVSTRARSLTNSRDSGAELLVLTTSSDDAKVYRRLPPTLPLNEAEAKGYIQNFGRVIVRVFKGEVDSISSGYSKSIESGS